MTLSAIVAFMAVWLILPAPPLAEASTPPALCQDVLNPEETIHRAIHQVAELKLRLDIAQSQGSHSPVTTALAANVKEKQQELVENFEKNQIMTRDQLTERIKQEIFKLQNKEDAEQKENSRRRKAQENQFKKSVIDGTRAIFHRIEPGSFKMGEPGDQVDLTLSTPFEMMATPVTQIVWKKVVDLATAKYPSEYDLKPNPSFHQGDIFPVEKVSYHEVLEWIDILNRLSREGEPLLTEIIPSHKNGDLYRLPSEAEWEFVAQGGSPQTGGQPLLQSSQEVEKYAWVNENSASQTQPVAKKTPLTVQQKEFYDLLGNVWELVADRWQKIRYKSQTLEEPRPGGLVTVRGGGFDDPAEKVHIYARDQFFTHDTDRSPRVGFRLARTAQDRHLPSP